MMRKTSAYLLISLLLSCLSITKLAAANFQEDFAIIPEAVLRNLAKKTVMPLYPEAAKKRGAKGRVVAQLDVDKGGNITNVRVLESPDADIEKAVIEAVKQWEFGSAYAGEERKPVRVRGKLTFYFVVEGSQARVQNPRKFN